jgi:Sec-independent protein translocase protein TatA
MFGIGLGEILLVMFIIFMISPKDLPKVMRKIGVFFRELDRMKKDLSKIKDDIEEITSEINIDEEDINPLKNIDENEIIYKKGKKQRKNKIKRTLD